MSRIWLLRLLFWVSAASRGVTMIGVVLTASCLVSFLGSFTSFTEFLCLLCDAGRRFARVLSYAFLEFKVILSRPVDAPCRFVSILSCGVPMLLLVWFGIVLVVVTVGVATHSVSSIISCRSAFLGSSTMRMCNLCRHPDIRLRHARRRFVSVVSCCILKSICAEGDILCRRRNTVFVAVFVYSRVSCMSSRGSHIVEYYRKITSKTKIFTDNRTQDSFLVCVFNACDLISEKNVFFLGSVLLSCLLWSCMKLPRQD
jgi:hypothetical protein